MSAHSKLGFTLIEILVVISIIGILATLVAANLNSARSRARDAERKSDLKNIQTALRLYFNDYDRYPGANSGNIKGCGPVGTDVCQWGDTWSAGSGPTIYMKPLPADPLPSQVYEYEQGSDTDTYTLTSCLENSSDTQGVSTYRTLYDSLCSQSHWMFQVSQ